MTSFDAGKRCENCNHPIPDDFNNLLCVDCYTRLENAKILEPPVPEQATLTPAPAQEFPNQGILDHSYRENPEMPDKDQVQANMNLFLRNGVMLWKPTRNIYNFIKDYCRQKGMAHPQWPKFIWMPKVVDVGCGCGVGANIVSEAADFVWGIDKNEQSIKFAQECFTRVKNNFYYHPQITFDCFDFLQDTREVMKFDIVLAIEIIEHIYDARGFVQALIKKFAKRDKRGNLDTANPTEFFISSPNRNNKSISKSGPPSNIFHIREWTSGELLALLSEYFQSVELFNAVVEPIPAEEYPTTLHTPLLYKCKLPK